MDTSARTSTLQIEPLPVHDVTARCITLLRTAPLARANEKTVMRPGGLSNRLIPQTDDSIFLKLYVSARIINDGKLEISSVDFFPNYHGRVFEVTHDGRTQLLLAGVSQELDIGFANAQSLPFLVYIPPSPQDTPKDHQKRFPELYAGTSPNDIPLYFNDQSSYPYSWDYLFFQFYMNTYRLSYQLKRAGRPYVFVVPMVRSFSDGLGVFGNAAVLERALLGIQKFLQDEALGAGSYMLDDLKRVTLCAFSIGNSILSAFINKNLASRLWRDVVKDVVLLDPPPLNPNNRSDIVDVVIRTMATTQKNLFLYAQDPFYVAPVVRAFLAPKHIGFDTSRSNVFADPRIPNVFIALLEEKLFQDSVRDPVLKDVHNTFPNLFICNAAQRSALKFASTDGKLHPELSFLWWAPSRTE